jgi:hypothetical protein
MTAITVVLDVCSVRKACALNISLLENNLKFSGINLFMRWRADFEQNTSFQEACFNRSHLTD